MSYIVSVIIQMTLMKTIFLFLITFFTFTTSFCQVAVTVAPAAPVNYATLKAAFDAINAGTHQGIIAITINGATMEAATAVLNASGTGSASYTGISINPTGGTASSITGNIAGPLIDLNGADNVTMDGLNSGGNALTISNTNTGNAANTSTIRFVNDATANTIQNITLLGATTNVTSGTLYFSTGTTIGNDNNTISNCNLADGGGFPVNSFYSAGTAIAGQENSGNTLSNNNVSNYFNANLPTVGILISTGNTDWTLNGNKLFQTATRTFTTGNVHRAIQVASGNNYNIINNSIGSATASGTGVYTIAGTVTTTFIAIDLSVGSTVVSSIQNNTITNFTEATSSNAGIPNGVFCAINITSGDANIGTVTGNTIGSITSTGNIIVNPTVANAYVVPINSSSTGNISISKNMIGGIDILSGGVFSGNINCIEASGAGGTVVITKNIIGNTQPNNIRNGVLGTTTGTGQMRAIFNTNTGIVSITLNTITNLTNNTSGTGLFRAIECQSGTAIINSNTISAIATNGTFANVTTPLGVGILVTDITPGVIVSQNTISGLSAVNTIASANNIDGIYVGSTTNGIIVTRNQIYGLSNASTSVSVTAPSVVSGIICINANIANPMTLANNMISLGNGQTTNTSFIGIWSQASASQNYTARIYYNSINIEGTAASGAQPSFCYYRGNFSITAITVPTIDIKDNIFTNSRSGGTGKHYAISNAYGAVTSSATGWAANVSDYNVLTANAATIGYWSGDKTFAAWKTASAGDANSLSGFTVNYVNSASDLHLVTSTNNAVNGAGTPLAAVTTDFDNDSRDAVAPDPGADEFTPTVLAISMEYFRGNKQGNGNILNWKAACSSSSITFEIQKATDGRHFAGIGSISATQARCSQPFDFTDNNPLQFISTSGEIPHINYYRLKMTEPDGKITYSTIIAIINNAKGFEILGLSPTIVDKGIATLNVSSSEVTNMQIVVTDMLGKIIQKQNAVLVSGSNAILVNLSKLSSGVYQITGYSNGLARTIRFEKL